MPEGYVITLTNNEKTEPVKIFDRFKTMKHSTVAPHAFTEKGLYMLATILKGDVATDATISIIETFTKLRELARAIQTTNEAGVVKQEDQTKRIYKIICSQADKTEYFYPIKQLREDFELSANYTNSQIKQKILDPARDRIKESNADVWFDYEMITRYPKNNGRKPMADTVVFHIRTIRATNGTHQSQRNKI